MTERELRRTALVIPPKGRAVLCIWAAAAGLFLAPFAFWQSVPAGSVFCLLWAVLTALLRARACSYAAVLGEHTLTIYAGIAFPVRRVVPRRAVTGIQQFRSPLLRLAGVTVLVISAPGARVLVPAVPAAQAAAAAQSRPAVRPLRAAMSLPAAAKRRKRPRSGSRWL